MKRSFPCALLALTLSAAPLALGQQFPKGTVVHYPPRGPASLQKSQKPAPLAQRRKQLHDLLDSIHQYWLKTHPVYASIHGHERYDADLTDYSASAWEKRLNQANSFMMRLAQIDTTGMTAAEKQADNKAMQKLIAEQTAASSRPWETPVTATSGLPFSLPELPAKLRFQSVRNYDDYIARLIKVPTAFRQISDDILLGIQDENPPSPAVIHAVAAQVRAVTSRKPEDSPFALPLRKFPASISAAQRARIRKSLLAAISNEVYPAYRRLGRFMASLPRSEPAAAQPNPPSKTPPSKTPKVHP